MRMVIVSTGNELIRGKVVDTNSNFIAFALDSVGVEVDSIVIVGDDKNLLVDVLKRFVGRVDGIVVTGGLGPTDDDITRFALAELMGVELILDEISLDRIKEYFRTRGRVFCERNKIQAMIPKGAVALDNPVGTAPGIKMELGGTTIFALPGVPREMRVMFEKYVLDWLNTFKLRKMHMRKLNCVGLGESSIASELKTLVEKYKEKVEFGTTVDDGIISLYIRSDVKSLVDEFAEGIYGVLGKEVVFSEDDVSLPEVVGSLLRERKSTLGVAESCTGGLLGKVITDVPGSSEYFIGGVVGYSNQMKEKVLSVPGKLLESKGAVSAEVAEEMVRGIIGLTGADFGLAITGIAGPGGGSSEKPVGLVYTACGSKNSGEIKIQKNLFGSIGRDAVRVRSVVVSLNMLRLMLIND